MMGTHTMTRARLTATAHSTKATMVSGQVSAGEASAKRRPSAMGSVRATPEALCAKRQPSGTGTRMRSPSTERARKCVSLAHMIVVAEMGSVR